MVDLEVLKKRGGTVEELKKKFTAEKLDDKIKALIDMNSSRIDEGIQRNLNEARTWYAIDQAFDASQRQITYTLVEGLLSKGTSTEKVMDAMKSMGLTSRLSNMLLPLCNSDGTKKCGPDGKPLMKLDMPTFFHIFVPLVQAYTKMRWAKLFSDRDIYPLYKYEPVSTTMQNRVRCEIITSRIQRMVQEMGYREDERQSILQMLKYGICLNFPAEDFYREKQIYIENKKEIERTIKEGVRFEIPHPSRMFYDLNSRLSTANTDTGIEYAGFWNVLRYKDVKNNKQFWNTKNIQFKYGSWVESKYNFYREINPCMLKFPDPTAFSPGAGDTDRIREAYRYTTNHQDEGVTVVSYFQKLIPSEWNLFDYDNPVWMRFIHTGSHTVSHAVPLAYNPLVAYLYDADMGSARNSSLALEILPFQDHLSNMLTQYILTVKQNLERIVFWNSDVVDQKYIDIINNLGEKKYRGVTFVPYSKRELSWQQQSERDAFTPVQLPQGSSGEIASGVNQLLSMMERVLGFSPQEVGLPAAHEQTAQEVQIIASNTSNRLELTGSFIDAAIKARKKLLYEAFLAYSDDEVLADVAEVDEVKKQTLDKMGFKVDEPEGRNTTAGIRGSKDALRVDGFSSDREGADRIVDSKLAGTMIQTFQSIFANPVLAQAAGLDQLVDLFNQVLVYSGAPKDFRLRVQPQQEQPSPEEAQQQQAAQEQQQAAQQQQIQEQLAQMASQIVDGKLMELSEGLRTNLVEPMQVQSQQTTQAIQQLAQQQDQQSQALVRLFQIIQSAQQDPNVGSPSQVAGGYPVGQAPEMAPVPGVLPPQAGPVG
jgi:hypothetical protein